MARGVHKNPFLGWNPPAEDSAWAREEAERRGGRGALSTILTEALREYRAKHSAKHPAEPVSPPAKRTRKPAAPPAETVAEPARKPAAKGKCEHRVSPGSYCTRCKRLI